MTILSLIIAAELSRLSESELDELIKIIERSRGMSWETGSPKG